MLGIANYFYRLIPGNPIFLRVVQGAGKLRRDMIIRWTYLGLLAGFVCIRVLGIVTGGSSLTELAQASGNLFESLSYIQLGLVALLAPVFTAGAITQEQDAQTYDILLSTPLTNGQIVLGSMLSRVFFIFSLLLSGIPIFSITQVFGGVAINSIILSFGIACTTAMVTGSLAMAIAALKVGTRRTIFAFYFFIVVYLVGGFFLDRVEYFHPEVADRVVSVQASGPPAQAASEIRADVQRDRIAITEVKYTLLESGDGERYRRTETTITRAKTSWFTGLNPFLALRVIFTDPDYIPPQHVTLPDALQSWPMGWYLSRPQTFYTAFMFAISFVLVIPSILLLRRVAQSTATLRNALLGMLHLSSGDRSRKPRGVWNNPIAWREARTRASAARAMFIRYGFMVVGVMGAFMLAIASCRVTQPLVYVNATSYNAVVNSLTIYDSLGNSARTYGVSALTVVTCQTRQPDPDAPTPSISLEHIHGTFEVLGRKSSPTNDSDLISLTLSPPTPVLAVATARGYLMGMVILEFAGILLIVTNAAASTVTREREDGTLDLLLSTPMTSRYYIWGKLRGLVSFVLPLVGVPVASVLFCIAADIYRSATGSLQPSIVFPESVLVLPGTIIIVAAFAAIVGMHMSLRSRTTVWAVMSSVGIVVGICVGLGACGFALLGSVPTGGSAAMAVISFSPITLISVLLDPFASASHAFGAADVITSRVLVVFCGWMATAAYGAVVWMMYKSMVKNFDMTIRRQSQ